MPRFSIPERSGREFVAGLALRQARLPLEGVVETTFRCNLNCVHCYVNLPAGDRKAREAELTTARLLRLLDELAEAGTLTLLLTGGEVACRRDLPDVYLHAIERGLRVVVFTNGTMVSDRVADLFARHPPVLVEISVYGATAPTYEAVTRVPGSFRRCLGGIERLRRRGVRLGLKTTVMRENVAELRAMEALAASLHLPFRYDGELNARVDCGASRQAHQVDPARLAALELDDPRRVQAYREQLAPQPAGTENCVYTCGAGRTSFTVDPYGRLQLCQIARMDGYDLKHGTFAEGWAHLGRLIERKWQSTGVCRSCSLRSGCGSCAGAAELETGDPEGIVPVFCELTHRRAFGVLAAVPGHRADARCCLPSSALGAAPGRG